MFPFIGFGEDMGAKRAFLFLTETPECFDFAYWEWKIQSGRASIRAGEIIFEKNSLMLKLSVRIKWEL